jgi:hypothetical protein
MDVDVDDHGVAAPAIAWAAARAAATMFLYPVQRQRLPETLANLARRIRAPGGSTSVMRSLA